MPASTGTVAVPSATSPAEDAVGLDHGHHPQDRSAAVGHQQRLPARMRATARDGFWFSSRRPIDSTTQRYYPCRYVVGPGAGTPQCPPYV